MSCRRLFLAVTKLKTTTRFPDLADALARKVPKRAWQWLSVGDGAKGQRLYNWAVVGLAEPAPGRRQLLMSPQPQRR